jgi:hypothetical protein
LSGVVIPLLQEAFNAIKSDEQTAWILNSDLAAKYKIVFDQFVAAFDYKFNLFDASGLDLCLIDVGSGSDTRVMAR